MMPDKSAINTLKDNGIDIDISVSIGSAELKINQILNLGRGAVVELNHTTNDYVDIYANNTHIGYGEIVIANNEVIGISIVEIFK